MTNEANTTQIQSLLDRLGNGDESALEELLVHSQNRLRRMAHRMLAGKPHVHRWYETDDVLQNSLVRLCRSLKTVKPESVRGYCGLVATQIRRELIDMARSLYGPEGQGRNHKSDPGEADPKGNPHPLYEKPDPGTDVVGQLEMVEFHETVDQLEPEQREVFELIFYEGLSRAEVASLLAVSERTIKRRWREARLALSRVLGSGES
jgi:RNA polymerase sigma factor (sigma-70 family)